MPCCRRGRQFLQQANIQLSGSAFNNIFQVNGLTEQLNAAFASCSVTTWARNHLRITTLPGDYNFDGTVDAADGDSMQFTTAQVGLGAHLK